MTSAVKLASTLPVVVLQVAHEDRAFVESLTRMLGSEGANLANIVTRSPSEPPPIHNLQSAKLCIIVISHAVLESEHLLSFVRSTIEYKWSGKFALVLRESLRPGALPLYLRQAPRFDFSTEEQYAQATQQLRQYIEQFTPAVPGFLRLQADRRVKESPATPSLLRLLAYAARINRARGEMIDITFGAAMYAFTLADDPLSRWFSEYVRQNHILDGLPRLLSGPKIVQSMLDKARHSPLDPAELEQALRPSTSTLQLLSGATSLLQTVSGDDTAPSPPLDVRHLMAACIYLPGSHEKGLSEAGLERPRWSIAFLNQMALLHPEELTGWKDIHHHHFPSQPIVLETEGPSPHIASDIWTVKDSLGYRGYAYAIYRFMTHRQTRSPLTVSIQAPWGGGKTSLMRMIQQEMDPDAFEKPREPTYAPRGALTLANVLKELDAWSSSPEHRKLPEPTLSPAASAGQPRRLTVWFNAWKYESTNQVWAGLVDAVTQQVADRLPPRERELFWLRLNLKRLDADAIRQKVHDRIFNYFWRGARGLLLGFGGVLLASLAAVATGSLTNLQGLSRFGLGAALLSVLSSLATAGVNAINAQKKVEQEPAAVSLSEYLSVPDYSKELGFLHHAEADLRRVLDSIPEACKPIVIFIDDLDRCSPANVARVVEAVNLFLAGDFPDCMFVLGMDTELVAAALQSAHKDMIAFLPTDAGIPLGWRFMDKFVQLPFIIPPPETQGVTRLTGSLFSLDEESSPLPDSKMDTLARETAARILHSEALEHEVERAHLERNYDAAQLDRLKERTRAFYERRKLDEGIARFTDQSEEMRQVLRTAFSYFQGNPRELKRFVNSFRFQYFVWYAHRARGLPAPSLEQLVRWTVLSMKWPELVRWLRRESEPRAAAGEPRSTGTASRLQRLEAAGSASNTLAEWQQKLREDQGPPPETAPWLRDEALFHLFQEEGRRVPESERLSASAGKGLW